jgi:hypothetical protein
MYPLNFWSNKNKKTTIENCIPYSSYQGLESIAVVSTTIPQSHDPSIKQDNHSISTSMHRTRSPRSMPQNRRSNNPFAGGKGRSSRTSMSYTDSRYGKQHGMPNRGGGVGLIPACICALVGLVAYGCYSFATSVPSTTLLTDMAVKKATLPAVEHKVFDVNNYPLSAPSSAHSQQTQTQTQLPPLPHTQTGTGIPPAGGGGAVGFSPPAAITRATAAPGLYPQIHPNIVNPPATHVPPQPRVTPISLSSAAAGTSIPPLPLSVPEEEYVPPHLGVLYGAKDPAEDEDEDEEGNSQDGKAPAYRASFSQNTEQRSKYGGEAHLDASRDGGGGGDSRDGRDSQHAGTEEKETNEDSQDFRYSHQDVAAATKDENEYSQEGREPPAYDGTSVGFQDPNVDADLNELKDPEVEHPLFSTAHTGLPPQIQEIEDAHHLSQGLDDPAEAGEYTPENETVITPANDDASSGNNATHDTAALGTMFTEMALPLTDIDSVDIAIGDMSPPNNTSIMGSARDDSSTPGDVVPLTQPKVAAFGTVGDATAATMESPVFFSSPYNASSNGTSTDIATDDSSTTLAGKNETSVSLNTTTTAMNVSSTSSVNVNASALSEDSIPSAITNTNTSATNATTTTAVDTHDNTTATAAWNSTQNATAGNSTHALLNATDTSVHPVTVQPKNATASPNSTHASTTHTTWSSRTTQKNATADANKQDLKTETDSHSNITNSPLAHNATSSSNATEQSDLPGKHKNSTDGTVILNSNTKITHPQAHHVSHAIQRQGDGNNTLTNSNRTTTKSPNGTAVNSTREDATAAKNKPKLRGTKPIRIPAGNVSTTALKQ